MKRNFFTTGAFALFVAAASIMSSCQGGNKSESSDSTSSKAKSEKKEKDDMKDVFIYTLDHRHAKFQPTENEKRMAITKVLESVNEAEFKDNLALEEVFLHTNIKHIVNGAFSGCKNIKAVHFPGEVAVINDEAFMNCSSLKNLKVDAWTVGLDCFKGCTSLQTAQFSEHLYWLRDGAFEGCKSLKQVIMPITVSKFEDPFKGCTSMEEFSVPNIAKNRMFGQLAESQAKWRTIYMLTTEYFSMPKNCTPNSNATLYVPDAFVAQFQQDADWSKFGKIEPLSKTKYYTAEGFWKTK